MGSQTTPQTPRHLGKGLKSWIWEDPNPGYVLAGRDFGLYCLMGGNAPRSSYTRLLPKERKNPPLENIPHEEVFIGMQILWIDIEFRIAERNLNYEIRKAVWV